MIALGASLGASGVHGAAGDFDATFGTGGRVNPEVKEDVESLPGGQVVVGGSTLRPGTYAPQLDFTVSRYDANGVLDTSYGVSGAAYCCSPEYSEQLAALVALNDGSVIGADAGGLRLARFLSNGAVDLSFGAPLQIDPGLGCPPDYPEARGHRLSADLAVDSQDRILVGGEFSCGPWSPVPTVFYPRLASGRAIDPSPQPTGDRCAPDNYVSDAYLVRLQSNGDVDGTWAGGVVRMDVDSRDRMAAVLPRSDGSVLVALSGCPPGPTGWVAKLTPVGARDTAFGIGGIAMLCPSSSPPTCDPFDPKGLGVDERGRILVAGILAPGGSQPNQYAVIRLSAGGQIDSTFGVAGIARVPGGTGGQVRLGGLLVGPIGMALAGSWTNGVTSRLQLIGLLATGEPDMSFGVAGLRSLPDGTTSNELRAAVSRGDGKIIATGMYAGSRMLARFEAPSVLVPLLHGASPSSAGSLAAGDPVGVTAGNFVTQTEDASVATVSFPIVFTRAYNSLAATLDGPLGFGWTHSFNISVMEESPGAYIVRHADGRLDRHVDDGTGTLVTSPDVRDRLTRNPDGTFTLTVGDATWLFDAAGVVRERRDRNGNATTFVHAGGRLGAVVAPDGRQLTLGYDSNGRLTTLTAPGGRVTRYAYSAAGDLVRVEDPAGGAVAFTCDAEHRIVEVTDQLGVAATTNTYDGQGRVVSQRDALGGVTTFQYAPGETIVVDARGGATRFFFDDALRVRQVVDPLGRAGSWDYDERSRLVRAVDPTGAAWTRAFDAAGRVVSSSDPDGGTTRFGYDTAGNLTSITGPTNTVTSMTYDAVGNLLTQTDPTGATWRFGYDPSGNLTTVTDPRGSATRTTYDAAGNVVAIEDALGNRSQAEYATDGKLTRVVDPLGREARFSYDAAGRLMAETDGVGNVTQFTYDASGALLSELSPMGAETSFEYDDLGRRSAATAPDGSRRAWGYDATGQVVSVTDEAGNVTTLGRDPVGRLASITDPLGRRTEYAYDVAGRLASRIDADGGVTSYEYDALGREVRRVYPDGETVTRAYDPSGRLAEMTDATGATRFEYDVRNRLTRVVDPAGQAIGYQYDSAGNRTALTYPDGTVLAYQYDAANRMVRVSDSLGRAITYAYDASGGLVETRYPGDVERRVFWDASGRDIGSAYASRGRVRAQTLYELDADGYRVAASTLKGTTRYTFDAARRLVRVARPNGKFIDYAYDSRGNRTVGRRGTSEVRYEYDAGGQLVTAGGLAAVSDPRGNLTACGEDRLEYDGAGRVRRIGLAKTGSCQSLAKVLGVKPAKASTSDYAYNGFGLRVAQTTAVGSGTPKTTRYVWDLSTSPPVVLSDGRFAFVHGLGLEATIDTAKGRAWTGLTRDGLGTVRGLIGASGSVKTKYDFDEFGGGTKSKLAPGGFGFAGEQTEASGLLYLRNRHYDPVLGRFLARDPLLARSPEIGSNPYGYVESDPINRVDPHGEFGVFRQIFRTVSVVAHFLGNPFLAQQAREAARLAEEAARVAREKQRVDELLRDARATRLRPRTTAIVAYGASQVAGTLRYVDNPFTAPLREDCNREQNPRAWYEKECFQGVGSALASGIDRAVAAPGTQRALDEIDSVTAAVDRWSLEAIVIDTTQFLGRSYGAWNNPARKGAR